MAGTIRQAPSPAKAIPRPRLEVMRSIGWLCVAAAGMLSILGAVAIGTVPPGPGETNLAYAHLAHLVIGLAAAVVVVIPHYRVTQKLSYPLLGVVVLMLIFVLIPWVPESIVRPRNGARRWINVVVTDFQPSELAKIAWVLALASYLRYRENYRRVLGLLLPLAITLIPMALILKEPDLGTALLFLPTLFAVLVAAGAKLRHLAAVIVIGLTLALSMYPLLEPHQKDRINAMIAQAVGDDQYINDIGFQGDRAMTLVGAGQWTGVGRRHAAAMVIYNALPEDHNDMIFAVVTCRWGVLGAVAVWGMFLVLCGGGLLIAAQCKDPFGRLVSVGLVAVLFSQMAINTGMTIGIMPITGMTLPFVSAGGSSLVSAWIMVGLLVNIAMRRQRYLAKEAFDFDGRDEA
ncbi:MAG: rod shape-determining protein RodA [Planctomycetota bacterium]|nr:MAG: rod shape-determining protein RodA [Planctomycetota bacterium]